MPAVGTAQSTKTQVVVDIAVQASTEVQSFSRTLPTVRLEPNAMFCAGTALEAPLQIKLHLLNKAVLSISSAFAQ